MLKAAEIVVALAALCSVAHAQYDSDVTNKCPQVSEDYPTPEAFYYSHPDSCTKFISCAFGLPYVLECPKHTVFNEEIVGCVHEKGPLDKCTSFHPTNKDICQGRSSGLIPNPSACQRYFNCSDSSSREYSHLDKYEDECDYPELFDHAALKCVPWNEANCAPGSKIGQDPCDYEKNLCVAAHCQPCKYRFTSCVGRPDGLQEHLLKLWSPWYANCESNRTVEMLFCDTLPEGSPHRMIFSPEKKQCVSLWEVPKEYDGYMVTCQAGQQGLFVSPQSNQVYYECPGAKVSYCEPEHIFSEAAKGCVKDAVGVTMLLPVTQTTNAPTTQIAEEPTTTLFEDLTTKLPQEPTTQAPSEPTTQAPSEPTTQVPTEPTTQAPSEPTTQVPTEPTTKLPKEPTTQLTEKPTTQVPEEPTTKLPVQHTTQPQEKPTTQAQTRAPIGTTQLPMVTEPSMTEVCKEGSLAIFPHPTSCQRYYNCLDTSSRRYSNLQPYEGECEYPDLFDSLSLRCVPYHEATCAPGAKIGQDPCDYLENQCVVAHCIECRYRFASCVGRPDGLNSHPLRPWSPFYVRCENNRSVEFHECRRHPVGSYQMIFSPELKHCVSVFEVPREFHGFAPKCKPGQKGYHVTRENDQAYYECPGAPVFYCAAGQVFSEAAQTCVTNPRATTTTKAPITSPYR